MKPSFNSPYEFLPFQSFILDKREEGDAAHPMYELVFMDEASGKSVINMPMPAEDASEAAKDNFANIYFDTVMKNYKVKHSLVFPRKLLRNPSLPHLFKCFSKESFKIPFIYPPFQMFFQGNFQETFH